MSSATSSTLFLLQIFVIVATCRVTGMVAKRFFRQPQVVGEMVAGIILGPSALGFLAPGMQSALFPEISRTTLYVFAQFGVALYMFVVGVGFCADNFRINAKSAVAVSLSGVGAPCLAAIAITPLLMKSGLFGTDIGLLKATMFMAAAISITAFPVLARIIQERGLVGTPLGSLALSAGAIDDVLAWTMFAFVLSSFDGRPAMAVITVLGGGLFAASMLILGPRILSPLGRLADRAGMVTPGLLAPVVMLLAVSAWVTDVIGLHSVFGAFLLGIAMPRGVLADEIRRQLEPFTLAVLVPVFFAFSGLNTRLTLVNSWQITAIAVLILLCSILAKASACWAAARLSGQDNRTAMALGALMNARGLMELIIANIGLQRGIITPTLFSLLVVMALTTTLMASPLFEAFYGRKARIARDLGQINEGIGNAPATTVTPHKV